MKAYYSFYKTFSKNENNEYIGTYYMEERLAIEYAKENQLLYMEVAK